jgi:hypothetical protein
MRSLRDPNRRALVLIVLAMLVSFGPHFALLAAQAAGAHPPAALTYICILHH